MCLFPVFAHLYFSSAPAESGTAQQRHSPGFFTPSEISHFHKSPKIKAASLSLFFLVLLSFPYSCYQSSLYESIVAGCDAWNNVLTLLFGLVSDGERRRRQGGDSGCKRTFSLVLVLFPSSCFPSPCTIFFSDQLIYSVFISWTDFKCFSFAWSWSVECAAAPPAFASPLNKTTRHNTTG